MNSFRTVAIWVLMVAAGLGSTAHAWASPHYLSLINDSADTLAEFAVRAHGSAEWTPFDVGPDRTSSVLLGGQTATLALRDGCVFDLRATFQNGRALTVMDFNACKTATLHLGGALRKATGPGLAEPVAVERIDAVMSRPGETKEAYLLRAGSALAAYTSRTGFVGCGRIWANPESNAWGVQLTSNHSHVGCVLTSETVGHDGWNPVEMIQSRSSKASFVVSRSDRLFLHEEAGVGETWHNDEPSRQDLPAGPGYVVSQGRLLYQDGPDSVREIGALAL